VANESLTPTEWLSILIYGVGGVVLASDLDDWSHSVAVGVHLDLGWLPVGLLVTETDLAVGVEAPRVKVTIVGEGNGVTKTGSAGLDARLVWEGDLSWSSDLSVAAETELSHLGLTPSVHLTLVGDSQGVAVTSSDVRHVHLVEELDKGWN